MPWSGWLSLWPKTVAAGRITSQCRGPPWPSIPVSRFLADALRRSDNYSLELGAGGGLVGLAVALGCTLESPVYVTDQLEMLSLMEHNIELNGLGSKAKPMILNWYVVLHFFARCISEPVPFVSSKMLCSQSPPWGIVETFSFLCRTKHELDHRI